MVEQSLKGPLGKNYQCAKFGFSSSMTDLGSVRNGALDLPSFVGHF